MVRLKNTAAKKTRRGTVAVLVVLSITLLLGIVAITLDGGLLQDNKRRLQNAADGAAIAAANTIFTNYPTIVSSGTADPGGKAAAAALKSSGDNGFPNNSTDTTVAVNIPPQSGPFTNKIGYAEVIVTYKQPRYFSTIWGSTATPVVARAVAKGYWGGTGNGVIVLDPSIKDALNSTGGAAGIVTGGAAMIVDSNNAEAAAAGGGGNFTADNFKITGGYSGALNGTVQTGVLPTPDPLAYLPPPPVPSNGSIIKTPLGNGNMQYEVMGAGRYVNFPSVNVGDVVIFKQASYNDNGGVYYFDGGGFKSTGATIKMDSATTGGIMIYNNPASGASSDSISISGNSAGNVTLSALTSGPYAGILMWQNRTATQALSIAGQGSFNLTGTFYAANANLSVSGNGVAIIGSQYISRTLSISGNGTININYTDKGTARKREVRLVE